MSGFGPNILQRLDHSKNQAEKSLLGRLGWLGWVGLAELLFDAVVCRFAYVSLLLPAVFGSFVPPLCVLCLQCCIGWRVSFVAEI